MLHGLVGSALVCLSEGVARVMPFRIHGRNYTVAKRVNPKSKFKKSFRFKKTGDSYLLLGELKRPRKAKRRGGRRKVRFEAYEILRPAE